MMIQMSNASSFWTRHIKAECKINKYINTPWEGIEWCMWVPGESPTVILPSLISDPLSFVLSLKTATSKNWHEIQIWGNFDVYQALWRNPQKHLQCHFWISITYDTNCYIGLTLFLAQSQRSRHAQFCLN